MPSQDRTPVDHRLGVYGSLAPGKSNHDQLAGLRGTWRVGNVKGRLVQRGWGASIGHPALVLDDDGGEIAIQLFDSPDLTDHWDRLDAFEGSEYRRTAVGIDTAEGILNAWVYLSADPER